MLFGIALLAGESVRDRANLQLVQSRLRAISDDGVKWTARGVAALLVLEERREQKISRRG